MDGKGVTTNNLPSLSLSLSLSSHSIRGSGSWSDVSFHLFVPPSPAPHRTALTAASIRNTL